MSGMIGLRSENLGVGCVLAVAMEILAIALFLILRALGWSPPEAVSGPIVLTAAVFAVFSFFAVTCFPDDPGTEDDYISTDFGLTALASLVALMTLTQEILTTNDLASTVLWWTLGALILAVTCLANTFWDIVERQRQLESSGLVARLGFLLCVPAVFATFTRFESMWALLLALALIVVVQFALFWQLFWKDQEAAPTEENLCAV